MPNVTKSPRARRAKNDSNSSSGAIDQTLVKAIAHPLRHQILLALNDEVLSPNQLSQRLGERLGNVSYHVRFLADLGAIELVDTQPRRGAVEHFYKAKQQAWFASADWKQLPVSTRRGIFGDHLKRIFEDVSGAAAAGGFDDAQAHVSYTPVELDERGFAEVAKLLDDTVKRVLAIHAESAARAKKSAGVERKPTEVAMLHFDRAPAAAAPRSRAKKK
jgi:DNA-binding transcriptional ArsR family regulator